jgi:S-adenosylmethionine:tRNA ribosyltransferase-isomerase
VGRAGRGADEESSSAQAALAGGVAGFDYELPADRIAQHPSPNREDARLLLVQRGGVDEPVDAVVRSLPGLLRPGDLLVVNRSRVIRARLRGRKVPSGGAVEVLLIAPARGAGKSERERWRALARPTRGLREGQRIAFGGGQRAASADGGPARPLADAVEAVVAWKGDGWVELEFEAGLRVLDAAERLGETPLPPYVRRPDGPSDADVERYQTVYATEPGSIAAPTAGLHLTERLLSELGAAGVAVAYVLLHVGPATFLAGRPGRSRLAVEPELYTVPRATRDAIARTSGRVVAVGTTTTRALESAARMGWPEGEASTDLVLVPGARFEVIDGLLTNFHLPGTSLLALVSAFAGSETARRAYAAALDRGYRFYSYGDAMLIL